MKYLISEERRYILQTYKRYPLILKRGDGVYLYDDKGRKYLDFLAGISVNNLGYNHKEILKVIDKASRELIHTSNLFYTEPQVQLAKKLSNLTNKGKVFFANSGAEANEAAIKLARAYGNSFSKKRYEIITLKNSFHGRTLATIFATGQIKYQRGFEPKIRGFKYIPINDINKLKKSVNEKTAAIMIELIQGEGGVNLLSKEFVSEIVKICKERDILFIVDEIQTGLGRSGEIFAFKHFKVIPDIVTVAKSLANGFPIGAMIVKNKFAKYLSYGMHASTFGGGYLITSVASKVIDIVSKDSFLKKVKKKGEYFKRRLEELKDKKNNIKNVKGIGLMLGIELNQECSVMVNKAIQNGLIINCIQGNILRFLPPLIISEKEIDEGINILQKIL